MTGQGYGESVLLKSRKFFQLFNFSTTDTNFSWLKVKSSVIRLVKRAFQESKISLLDEAREVTFPHGVPVRMVVGERVAEPVEPALTKPGAEPEAVSTKAEAGLKNEAEEIKEQARGSWTPGENLLTSSSADPG